MYNENLKEGFIKDYMRTRVVAQTSLYSLFRKVEPYEQKLNKDCSEFTEEEILKMYKEFEARSHNVLLNYNVILKAYCAWKKHYHGLENDIAYENITTEMARDLIPEDAKRVLSREEVTEIEDQLYNWTDKAIIEALFEGLSGNSMRDLTGVELSMVNQKEKQLVLPDGRVFDLTDRLCDMLVKACNEYEYVCYGDTLKVKKLFGGKGVYKERDNAHAADSDDKFFRWVYRRIMSCRKFLGIDGLTMKNLQTAGMVHYLKLGLTNTGLGLKEFLLTEDGQKLMDKYNYFSEHRVDNIVARYKQFI
jgi:hypothetical protein